MAYLKSRTLWFGYLLAAVPQALDYLAPLDWVALGLAPNTATVIGAAIIVLRAVTTKPLSDK